MSKLTRDGMRFCAACDVSLTEVDIEEVEACTYEAVCGKRSAQWWKSREPKYVQRVYEVLATIEQGGETR